MSAASVPKGMTDHAMCGATVAAAGVTFRVWAPQSQRVQVVFDSSALEPLALSKNDAGYFECASAHVVAGTRYRFQLDAGTPMPDPCSRFQPDGVHGSSMVIDPSVYVWRDAGWQGLDPARQTFYELHIGAFTADGTYAAAADKLERLAELGVTCIELMPLAEFSGRRGWGYDGVDLYAPYHGYGTPDELRAFVDQAHSYGLGVILDVVYNHVGAQGNYLPAFSPDYFTDRHSNEWGQTVNYYCESVRAFAINNAAYWIREYHFDGLRLDAIQSVHDPEYPSLITHLSRAARAAAHPRRIVIAAEDYLQRADLLRSPEKGGAEIDFLWNDDFHHSARVAATGHRGGYFANYEGTAQELLACLQGGFLFQGQKDPWKGEPRGLPTRGISPYQFIAFTQNHDQVANTLSGVRLSHLTSPAQARALTATLLLGPQTPLLFMGEEFAASTPFAYFADYESIVAEQLWAGRRRELAAMDRYAGEAAQASIEDPSDENVFRHSKLDWTECDRSVGTLRLYQSLLRLRRDDPVLTQRPASTEGAILSEHAFVLHWFDSVHGDRLLVVNLGREIPRRCWAAPLLAAPPGCEWALAWTSDHPDFGGLGIVTPETAEGWFLSAQSAYFLKALPVPVTPHEE